MTLTIVATVSEKNAPLNHSNTKFTTNSKTNETVLTNNKMSKKHFYGIRNKKKRELPMEGNRKNAKT